MRDKRTAQSLDAGDVLFSEGDVAGCAYLVESGRLRVSVNRGRVSEVLAELGPGSLIGEMALLDSGPRTATVVALEPSVVQRLEPGHLEKRLHRADPLLRHMMELLIGRYRELVRRLDGTLPKMPPPAAAAPASRYHSLALQRLRTDQELQNAFAQNQFELHFQPIMQIASPSVAGFEALVRWLHPHRGLVLPGAFIPAAEESGLIVELGRRIIDQAVLALAQIDAAAATPRHGALPFMSVNLSRRQFSDPELLPVLVAALERHHIAPDRLHLELTESSLSGRIEEIAELIRPCAGLGVKIVLDNFGAGHTALSDLYRLPLSGVNLARPLLADLAAFPESAKVIGAVLKVSRELGLGLVAKGIEERSQAALLAELGIEHGQGFLYAAALPLEVAAHFFRRWQAPQAEARLA